MDKGFVRLDPHFGHLNLSAVLVGINHHPKRTALQFQRCHRCRKCPANRLATLAHTQHLIFLACTATLVPMSLETIQNSVEFSSVWRRAPETAHHLPNTRSRPLWAAGTGSSACPALVLDQRYSLSCRRNSTTVFGVLRLTVRSAERARATSGLTSL